MLEVFFVGRVCSCGGSLSCGAVCRCVLGTEAVIFLLAAAFRVMFRAMPLSFLSLEAFSAGNALLFSGIRRIRYRRGPPTVRNMRAVQKTGSWGTRRIFGSIWCKKQASTVRKRYSVPKTAFSGTRRIFKGALNSLLPTECIFESAKNGILSHRTHLQCAKRPPLGGYQT